MERLGSLFGGIYKGRKVLLTGHTGFKGSWLGLWLKMMGADVYGYALEPVSNPSHYGLLHSEMEELKADLRDLDKLKAFVNRVQPEIVFHLAAQALVRASYDDPVGTISTNVMGTLHVFEACRATDSVKTIINVTSDKCYENEDWIWGYRENDRMGGYDPYSASKGMSELLTASYRNSYFNLNEYGKSHHTLLGSVRAGNVIGGGDWAQDRLIPDMVKAASSNAVVEIRNPMATRPWQHVLEPLSGYLMLGWKLLEGKKDFADGWNFGPEMGSNLSVGEITNLSMKVWDSIKISIGENKSAHHEANLLMLDCSKANKILKWKPIWKIDVTIQKTIGWYMDYYNKNKLNTLADIRAFVENAETLNAPWTS
ncbi:MAG: CDP-glucose 4,6-dehydratase [Bacteroidales bacterium]|nr:CDP-glucose 4,6-dehydratase [Bacteroidales bacterium]